MVSFKIGDVVVARGSHQRMTVASVKGTAVWCRWFIYSDAGGWSSLQEKWFHAFDLKIADLGFFADVRAFFARIFGL